jgi:O-antigen/teichoic acid export membrane protein
MFKHKRTKKMASAGYGAYLGKFGMGLSAIFLIPALHSYLNSELFGVWMMISSFAAFSVLLDFGIGNALIKSLASKKVAKYRKNAYKNINTAYIILTLIAVITITLWLAWTYFSDNPYIVVGKINDENRSNAFIGFNLFVFIAAINIPASLIQKIQIGFQDGKWVGYGQFFCSLLTVISCYAVTYLKLSFVFIIAATVVPILFTNILLTIFWIAKHSRIKYFFVAGINNLTYKNLIVNGSLFFLVQIASIAAFNSDSILVPHILGQDEYGRYAVVQKIFIVISLVISSAMTGLWPAIGDALAKDDKQWIKEVCKKMVLASFFILVIAVFFLISFIDEILGFWINHSFQKPSETLIYLFSIWTFLEVFGILSTAIFNAFGLIASQAIIACIMALLIIICKFFFLSKLGINGAVISTIVVYLTVSLPYQFFLLRNLRKVNAL